MRHYFLCVAALSLFAISLSGCGTTETTVIEAPAATDELDTPYGDGMTEEEYAKEMEGQ
jgi:hypothetical protein